ncbi:MAG: Transcription antitermination protein NusG, partial [uncultured Solirubrobacteraceae bacterium]
VSLVRRQHLFRPREQGQAEPRAPCRLLEPEAQRPPGRRADRVRVRDEGQPEGHGREAHDARLRARQHGAQRGFLGPGQGHARRHGLRRRVQRAGSAHTGRGRSVAASRGRGARAQEGDVLDRRERQGHLRAAVGLLRRDLGDERGRVSPQGACVNLRSRDAGRGRIRSSEEGL